ncbi:MAG: major facilitator superfamily 1 [Herbinix sp.]|jgi:OPA family glycerol-3-phosphate transporter-like MFS transporter|nr:major facilitator superfamily 1 [Herbinix sp.]
MKKKLQNPKSIQIFVMVCWLAYFTTYLGRLNYSASMNEIVRVGFLTKPEAGMIGTGFFFCYGFGQLISGFLGDKIPSRYMVFAGIAGSASVNFMMAFASGGNTMLLLWCINGFIQSLIWAPIIKILSDRLTSERCKKACVFMSTTVAVGTLTAYVMSAAVIGLSDWRKVFLVSAGVVACISLVWFFGMGRLEKEAQENGIQPVTPVLSDSVNTVQLGLWKAFLVMGLIPVAFSVLIQGILKDGVTAWVPSYIFEVFHLGSVASILTTTLLPIVNIMGVYAANYLNNRFYKNEIKTSGVCFLVASLSLALMILFGRYHVIITVLLLALMTTGMTGANTMFTSLLPLYFTGIGKVASITGVLNFMAYAGSAVSTYSIGVISLLYGWDTTIVIWLVLAMTGSSIGFIMQKTWKTNRNMLNLHEIE